MPHRNSLPFLIFMVGLKEPHPLRFNTFAAHEFEQVPDLRERLPHLLVVPARSHAGLGAPGAPTRSLTI